MFQFLFMPVRPEDADPVLHLPDFLSPSPPVLLFIFLPHAGIAFIGPLTVQS